MARDFKIELDNVEMINGSDDLLKDTKVTKVTLTGECADEIFGGYPWFHKKECFDADCFPWSMDFSPRTMLLKDSVLSALPIEEYAHEAYLHTLSEVPVLDGENKEEPNEYNFCSVFVSILFSG